MKKKRLISLFTAMTMVLSMITGSFVFGAGEITGGNTPAVDSGIKMFLRAYKASKVMEPTNLQKGIKIVDPSGTLTSQKTFNEGDYVVINTEVEGLKNTKGVSSYATGIYFNKDKLIPCFVRPKNGSTSGYDKDAIAGTLKIPQFKLENYFPFVSTDAESPYVGSISQTIYYEGVTDRQTPANMPHAFLVASTALSDYTFDELVAAGRYWKGDSDGKGVLNSVVFQVAPGQTITDIYSEIEIINKASQTNIAVFPMSSTSKLTFDLYKPVPMTATEQPTNFNLYIDGNTANKGVQVTNEPRPFVAEKYDRVPTAFTSTFDQSTGKLTVNITGWKADKIPSAVSSTVFNVTDQAGNALALDGTYDATNKSFVLNANDKLNLATGLKITYADADSVTPAGTESAVINLTAKRENKIISAAVKAGQTLKISSEKIAAVGPYVLDEPVGGAIVELTTTFGKDGAAIGAGNKFEAKVNSFATKSGSTSGKITLTGGTITDIPAGVTQPVTAIKVDTAADGVTVTTRSMTSVADLDLTGVKKEYSIKDVSGADEAAIKAAVLAKVKADTSLPKKAVATFDKVPLEKDLAIEFEIASGTFNKNAESFFTVQVKDTVAITDATMKTNFINKASNKFNVKVTPVTFTKFAPTSDADFNTNISIAGCKTAADVIAKVKTALVAKGIKLVTSADPVTATAPTVSWDVSLASKITDVSVKTYDIEGLITFTQPFWMGGTPVLKVTSTVNTTLDSSDVGNVKFVNVPGEDKDYIRVDGLDAGDVVSVFATNGEATNYKDDPTDAKRNVALAVYGEKAETAIKGTNQTVRIPIAKADAASFAGKTLYFVRKTGAAKPSKVKDVKNTSIEPTVKLSGSDVSVRGSKDYTATLSFTPEDKNTTYAWTFDTKYFEDAGKSGNTITLRGTNAGRGEVSVVATVNIDGTPYKLTDSGSYSVTKQSSGGGGSSSGGNSGIGGIISSFIIKLTDSNFANGFFTATANSVKIATLPAKTSNNGVVLVTTKRTANNTADYVRLPAGEVAKSFNNGVADFKIQMQNGVEVNVPARGVKQYLTADKNYVEVKTQINIDLPQSVKDILGADVVGYEISAFADTFDLAGNVGVSLPYSLSGKDPNKLVAYAIAADGSLQMIKQSYFDGGFMKFVLPAGVNKFVVGEEAIYFDDIDHVAWAKNQINYLGARQILSGMADRTFAPDNAVTRAQFAKMLNGVFGFSGGSASFTDVNGQWFAADVAAAAGAGVVKGYEDGSFRPENTITREEMAVMIDRACKAAGLTLSDKVATAQFTDYSSIQDWATASVDVMRKAGVINGMEDGSFDPKGTALRSQAAKVTHDLYKLVLQLTAGF